MGRKQTPKKMSNKKIAIIFISCIVGLALVIAASVIIYKIVDKEPEIPKPNSPAIETEPPFADGTEAFDRAQYTISESSLTDIDEHIKNLKDLDEKNESYQLIICEEGSGKSLEINYWIESGKGVYEYIFSGLDAGSNLDGIYYRTVIDGLPTVIDYQTGEFHTDGDFFDAHNAFLSGMTIDSLMADLYSDGFVDIGNNGSGETVITSGDVSICYSSDGSITAIDCRTETVVGYYVCYGQNYSLPTITSAE